MVTNFWKQLQGLKKYKSLFSEWRQYAKSKKLQSVSIVQTSASDMRAYEILYEYQKPINHLHWGELDTANLLFNRAPVLVYLEKTTIAPKNTRTEVGTETFRTV